MSKSRRKKPFSFLWITDPWETLDHAQDTTLRLAHEALVLGYSCFWCDVRSVELRQGRASATLSSLELSTFPLQGERVSPKKKIADFSDWDFFDQIHYRVDPPVNASYWHPLQILSASTSHQRIVNPPSVLFQTNEKTAPLHEPGLSPPTLISCSWESLQEFGMKEQRTVAKPLDEAQSKGVELLNWDSKNGLLSIKETLSRLSAGFSKPVLLQRYLSGITRGERRCWFIDGKLLAQATKMPLPGDFRVNIEQGSTLTSKPMTSKDQKQVIRISKLLKRLKIRMAAVDLIDGWVSDFNVTSPGLIVEMEALLGTNLARSLIRRLVKPPH